jgi:hypothetical protein
MIITVYKIILSCVRGDVYVYVCVCVCVCVCVYEFRSNNKIKLKMTWETIILVWLVSSVSNHNFY